MKKFLLNVSNVILSNQAMKSIKGGYSANELCSAKYTRETWWGTTSSHTASGATCSQAAANMTHAWYETIAPGPCTCHPTQGQ